jgi:3-(3-hydroxy-phenyl)propionate hydroxylase
MGSFRHGRVLFAGDCAHQVSPFGARGANSGLQDADNLGWKLNLVLRGLAPESLLDSYSDERAAAADENLLNSTRSTDFITPKSQVSKDFRNAVLTLAGSFAFARALVNSGRLSVPAHLRASPLNTPDSAEFDGVMHPGAPVADAPGRHQGRDGWLLGHTGWRFQLLLFVDRADGLEAETLAALASLADMPVALQPLLIARHDGPAPDGLTLLVDHQGAAARRFGATPGTTYLLRPDQHVAARWRWLDAAAVRAALARAIGKT